MYHSLNRVLDISFKRLELQGCISSVHVAGALARTRTDGICHKSDNAMASISSV